MTFNWQSQGGDISLIDNGVKAEKSDSEMYGDS